MGASSSSNAKNEKYFKAYKSMVFINEISNNKLAFKCFLINIKTIPNFIKLIKDSIMNKNENTKKTIKKSFKNYKPEKQIELYYSFDECENIINQNLISENNFIIVDEYFFKYMNIKIKDKDKEQVVINIDKINLFIQ